MITTLKELINVAVVTSCLLVIKLRADVWRVILVAQVTLVRVSNLLEVNLDWSAPVDPCILQDTTAEAKSIVREVVADN